MLRVSINYISDVPLLCTFQSLFGINKEKNSVNSRLCIFFYFSHLTKRISKMVIKLFVILIFRRFFGRSAVSLIAIDKIFVKLDCCNCICTKYRIFLLFLSFFSLTSCSSSIFVECHSKNSDFSF